MPIENSNSQNPFLQFTESFIKLTDSTSKFLKNATSSQLKTSFASPILIAKSTQILVNTLNDIINNAPETSNISNKEILKKSWKEEKIAFNDTFLQNIIAKIVKTTVKIFSNLNTNKTQDSPPSAPLRPKTSPPPSKPKASPSTNKPISTISETPTSSSGVDSHEISEKFEELIHDFFTHRNDPAAQQRIKNEQSQLLSENTDKKVEKELQLRQKTAENLIENFQESDFKTTFQETVTHICEKHNLTKSDIKKEALLLGDFRGGGAVSEEVAMMKMVNRLAIYKKGQLEAGQSPSLAKRQEATGFEPSVIKGVEKLFKQYVRGEVTSDPKKIENMVAIPTKNGIILEEKEAGEGSFKVAIFASDYFSIKRPEDRQQFVTLKPKEENLLDKEPELKATIKGNSLNKETDGKGAEISSEESFDTGTTVFTDDESIDTGTTVFHKETLDTGTTVFIDDESIDTGTTVFHKETLDTGTTVFIDDESIDTGTTVFHKETLDTGTTVIDSGTTVINKDDEARGKRTVNNNPQEKSPFVPQYLEYLLTGVLESTAEEKISWDDVNPEKLSIDKINGYLRKLEVELKDSGSEKNEKLLEMQSDLQKYLVIRDHNLEIYENYKPLSDKEEFLKEIKTTMQLQGEGVVKIKSIVDLNSGNKIMIQEAAGYKLENDKVVADLDKMMELYNENELNDKEELRMLQIALDAFKGVARLHDEGYILRDLKEENILVTKDGKGVLADFGTVVKKDGDPSKSTYAGTPLYSSPESCKYPGTEFWNDITEKSDVWSCGVILYMLAEQGEPPPGIGNSRSAQGIMISLGNLLTPKAEAAYNNRYPEPEDKDSLDHLIWSATRVNPGERPTMKELCSQFEQLIEKEKLGIA